MSNNPISSPNEVSTKSTFEDWRQITNQIIKRLNSLYSESGANGTSDDNLCVYNDATIGASGFGNLEVTGNIKVGKDLIIENDLIVKGSTTTVNTVDLIVKDRMVELNHDPFYRNHPYDSKLKSGFQVHIGVDDNNITTSYVNHENGSVTNQIQNIQYQIDENSEYEIDNDKTVITMSNSEPEATLHFNFFNTTYYTVGHIIVGEISGVKALVTNTLFSIDNQEFRVSVNYLEEETSFQIGEKVTQETWTQSQIDEYSEHLEAITQIDNNFSLSGLDFSNKKYLLRFRDTQGNLEPTKMFFVDSYDVSQNKLTVIGNVSGYTEYTNLKFDVQEIKTQRLYWDENSEKWVIDADINVLGDIYSNGSVLWRVNPLDSTEIYYNDKVKIGTTLSLNDWNITPRTAENVLDFKFDTTNIFSLSNSGNFLSLYGSVGALDGTSSLPSYTFTSDPNTGMYLSAPDNLSFSSGGDKRLTVKTDGVGVFGGLQLLGGNNASDSGGTIRYYNSDFEGRRLIGGEYQWVSLTQSNSSGYSSVYSKSITEWFDTYDENGDPVQYMPAWIKLTIPNSTSIGSEHYSFDFYGYSQSETPNSDNISQYNFYVNIKRIDSNTKTSEVIIKRIKSSSGVEEFEFYKITDNNDNVIIYAKMPEGETGVDILQTGSDEGYFEPLSNSWFSTLFIEPQQDLSGVNPLDVGNLTSQWEHNPTDESKIYYNGGYVGIGLDNPEKELHVQGTIRSNSLSDLPNPNPENVTGYVLASNSLKDIVSSSITIDELSLVSANKWSSTPNNIDIYRNTKVGVGDFSSTDLTEKLEVDGNIKSTGYISLTEGSGSGIDFKVDVNANETDKASIKYFSTNKRLILSSKNNDDGEGNIVDTALAIGNNELSLIYDINTYPVLHEGNFATLKTGYVDNLKNYRVQLDNGKMFVNVPWSDTTYGDATTLASGLMSADDKEKLDGIAENATNFTYSLPLATADIRGGAKIGFQTDSQQKAYPVQLYNEKMYVHVPWTDTIKWDDASGSTGIYRNSNVGIGSFSATTELTEKLEIRSTSGDSFIKISDNEQTQNAQSNEIGIILGKTWSQDFYNFKISSWSNSFNFKYRENSDAADTWSTSYSYIAPNNAHVFFGDVSSTGTITAAGSLTASESINLSGTEDSDVYIKVDANSGGLESSNDHLTSGIKFENKNITPIGNQKTPYNFKLENYYDDWYDDPPFTENRDDHSIFRLRAYQDGQSDKTAYSYSPDYIRHDIFGDLIVTGGGNHGGTGSITATGDIESTSDISIKENLEIIENPIEKIKELNGYTFNKNGEEKRSAGLVAQEVEKVLPEVVSENGDGIKSLAYGNIVALLVETVKEQQKQIDELKKQISDK